MTAQERAERFDLMYRDHYGAVLAYGRRRGARSPEDTAAEVYTVAWATLASVPQDALPWLLATARKLLANERRKDSRRADMPPLRPPTHATLEDPDLGSALAALSRADRESCCSPPGRAVRGAAGIRPRLLRGYRTRTSAPCPSTPG
jgi:DNA-directed RNA polymerase specialized sigma24 family protein